MIICITKESCALKESLINRYNTLKFNEIITSKDKYDRQTICKFVVIINKGVCPPSYTELLPTCTYIVYLVYSVFCISMSFWFMRNKDIYITVHFLCLVQRVNFAFQSQSSNLET